MPTYSYRCTECGNAFDIQQSFADDSLTVCPVCGGKLRKVFSPIGVTFNGSGFYRTDSRAAKSEGGGASGGSGSKGESGSKSEGGSKGSGSGGSGDSAKSGGGSTTSSPASSKPAGSGSSTASSSGGSKPAS